MIPVLKAGFGLALCAFSIGYGYLVFGMGAAFGYADEKKLAIDAVAVSVGLILGIGLTWSGFRKKAKRSGTQ